MFRPLSQPFPAQTGHFISCTTHHQHQHHQLVQHSHMTRIAPKVQDSPKSRIQHQSIAPKQQTHIQQHQQRSSQQNLYHCQQQQMSDQTYRTILKTQQTRVHCPASPLQSTALVGKQQTQHMQAQHIQQQHVVPTQAQQPHRLHHCDAQRKSGNSEHTIAASGVVDEVDSRQQKSPTPSPLKSILTRRCATVAATSSNASPPRSPSPPNIGSVNIAEEHPLAIENSFCNVERCFTVADASNDGIGPRCSHSKRVQFDHVVLVSAPCFWAPVCEISTMRNSITFTVNLREAPVAAGAQRRQSCPASYCTRPLTAQQAADISRERRMKNLGMKMQADGRRLLAARNKGDLRTQCTPTVRRSPMKRLVTRAYIGVESVKDCMCNLGAAHHEHELNRKIQIVNANNHIHRCNSNSSCRQMPVQQRATFVMPQRRGAMQQSSCGHSMNYSRNPHSGYQQYYY